MTKARICCKTLLARTEMRTAAVLGAGWLLGGLCLPAVSAFPAARSLVIEAVISTTNARQAETEAGDSVADAVRAASGAEIAFVPAAAFKPSADAPRPATAEQIAALLDPPTDQIVVLNIKGAQIHQALARSVSFAPQPSAGFLQISGIRFSYDLRRDSADRIVSATVGGKPLETDRVYRVAMPRPLANGQQGYFQMWDKKDVVTTPGPPKTLADSLTELAKSHAGMLSPMLDGRITAIGQ